jgi:hypothetical protein
MWEPRYQPDVNGLAEELKRAHGVRAVDIAVQTAKEHLRISAWKHCAMWLQVVNHLQEERPH